MEEPLPAVLDRINLSLDAFAKRMNVTEFEFTTATYDKAIASIRQSLDFVRKYDADKDQPVSAVQDVVNREQLRGAGDNLRRQISDMAFQLMFDCGSQAHEVVPETDEKTRQANKLGQLRDAAMDEEKDEFTALLKPVSADLVKVWDYIKTQQPAHGKDAGGDNVMAH